MNDLDEQLKSKFTTIASDHADSFYPKGDKHRGKFIRDAGVLFALFLPEIHEIFEEAGYVKPKPNQAVIIPQKIYPQTYMTNGEYLTRFQAELNAEKPYMSPGEYKHALVAAERAAGIK